MFHSLQRCRAVCGPLRHLSVRCISTSSYTSQQAATTQIKSFDEIPGPTPLPLVGNLIDLMLRIKIRGERLSEYHHKGLEKYGGVMKLILPGVGKMVVVADPDVMEQVLRAEGKYPVRDTSVAPNMNWFFKQAGHPPGFGSEEGEEWRQGRSAANKQIQPRNVNSYIEGLNPIYSRFTSFLRQTRDENQEMDDLWGILQKLTMEATGKFVYGADLNLLVNAKEEDEKFLDHVNDLFDGFGRLLNEPPIYKVYRNKFYYFFVKTIQSCLEYGTKYADKVLEKMKSGEKPDEVQGMLEQWLREKKMSTKEALSLSSGMLAAGIHTTATQSTFLLYEMAKSPEAQQRLCEEIEMVCGDKLPTAQGLASMSYLSGCIKESFRVRSTASGIPRVLQEDAIIHGYRIPAGVTVFYSSYSAAMNEKIFKEPSKFKPERWIRKDGPQQHPFSLLPFGFGPRACYGKRFAELEMKLLLIEMVRNFKLSTKMEDLGMVEHALVTPKEKVSLSFTDRN